MGLHGGCCVQSRIAVRKFDCSRMNILFCKNNFAGPISGADEIVLTYATELKAAGQTPSVLLVQPPAKNDPLAARLRAADVPLDTLASPAFSTSLATARRFAIRAMRTFTPFSALILSNSRKVVFNLLQQYHVACCEYLQRARPDVVHVLTPDPGAVMLVRAAHETKIPVVYQEVGIPFHPPGFEDVYERFVSVMPLCAEVTALSPALAQELHRVSKRSSPAKVLPLISPDHNGFPKSPSTNGMVTFGFAARLEHLKGPMRLLEAFSVAHQTHSEMKLCVAGEGSQRREFVAGSRRLGLEEKCELVGVYKSIEERSEFMKSIDVFVLPSLTEGTPNVIIEAMAHEKPIIATAVGGVPDLVPEDVGILVPPDDSRGLAEAMTRMAVDIEMRRRMGAAARRKYEQLFTPAVVLPVLLDLYSGMIEANNTGRPRPLHPWVNNRTTNHLSSGLSS
jgi:glycosyltransferase involved in cell wall biosynthesis